MYRTALVTTDGSSIAEAVFRQVREVVDPQGTVVVVEVIDDPARVLTRTTSAGFEYGMGSTVGPDLIDQVIAAQRSEAETHLAAARALLQDSGIANVETLIRQGLPGEVIVDEARSRQVGIVLMATHGRSGLRRTILGSVADHVLRHLDGIPVLLVRPEDQD